MDSQRPSFRLAVIASVMLHGLLGIAVVVWAPKRAETLPAIDTSVETPRGLSWTAVDVDVPAQTPVAISETVPEPLPFPPAPETPVMGSRPVAFTPPSTLPAEVMTLIRRPHVVEAPGLQPVAAAHPAIPRRLEGGTPVHGSLEAGQTIVYLLDASGSMGQGGKLERAKRALLATLREQPERVRFQVIVYSAFARTLLPGGCLPATEANVEQMAQMLDGIEPAGRSSHAEALRLVGTLNPEFVLVLTDADDLPADGLREMTARLARPPVVSLAVVRGDRVEVPRLAIRN